MFFIIFVFYKIGDFLDGKYPNENNLFTLGFILAGVFASMYYIITRIKKFDS